MVSIEDLKTREGVLRYPTDAAEFIRNSFSPLKISSCRILLDARDLDTLFQDNGGASLVTAKGQDVGRWVDKTSNATQFNLASIAPPVYDITGGFRSVYWAGNRRALIQSALNLSAATTVTTVTAVRKMSDAALARIASFGSAQPLFAVSAPPAASATFGSNVSGGTARSVTTAASFAAPVKAVVTTVSKVNALTPSSRIRINSGAWVDEALGAGATANFGTAIYALGGNTAGTGELLNGYIYAHALFTAELSAQDLIDVEIWMAETCGLRLF